MFKLITINEHFLDCATLNYSSYLIRNIDITRESTFWPNKDGSINLDILNAKLKAGNLTNSKSMQSPFVAEMNSDLPKTK